MNNGAEAERIVEKLLDLAKRALENTLIELPNDDTTRFTLFTEILRIKDYWFSQAVLKKDVSNDKSFPHLREADILEWGMKPATAHLYRPVPQQNAFPIRPSNAETQAFARKILYKFGCVSLLQSMADRIRYGLMTVKEENETIVIERPLNIPSSTLDGMDFDIFNSWKESIEKNIGSTIQGWKIGKFRKWPVNFKKPGNYLLVDKRKTRKIPNWRLKTKLDRLVRPWETGYGTMVNYSALPEVDNHYLEIALEYADTWRTEAGLHPSLTINGLSIQVLHTVILVIIGLYIKHIHLVAAAKKKFPEISEHQSLTIWGSLVELEESVASYTSLEISQIKMAMNAITLHPSESQLYKDANESIYPLLFSLGNGFVIRPVSSLVHNPFVTAMVLMEKRGANARDKISSQREGWMRGHLYAMFLGNRYTRIDGTIKIRSENSVLTDIDAAVLDLVTGELALFQFKWQDFFGNSIKSSKSKSSNLKNEMETWAGKLTSWLQQKDDAEIIQSLRLKLPKGIRFSGVYLFGISRSFIRTESYGFPADTTNIALSNWATFAYTRHKIGPARPLFSRMHAALKIPSPPNPGRPIPTTIDVMNHKIRFENLWTCIGEKNETSFIKLGYYGKLKRLIISTVKSFFAPSFK